MHVYILTHMYTHIVYIYIYIRKPPCSDVQNRELNNAVALFHASPCIEKSTCTFPCKSVQLGASGAPRPVRATPCKVVSKLC